MAVSYNIGEFWASVLIVGGTSEQLMGPLKDGVMHYENGYPGNLNRQGLGMFIRPVSRLKLI